MAFRHILEVAPRSVEGDSAALDALESRVSILGLRWSRDKVTQCTGNSILSQPMILPFTSTARQPSARVRKKVYYICIGMRQPVYMQIVIEGKSYVCATYGFEVYPLD